MWKSRNFNAYLEISLILFFLRWEKDISIVIKSYIYSFEQHSHVESAL